MYRPQKRRLVRRVSAASALALVVSTGVGFTLINHVGATTSAPRIEKSVTRVASNPATAASSRTSVDEVSGSVEND